MSRNLINFVGCMLVIVLMSVSNAKADDNDALPFRVDAIPDIGNFEVGDMVIWKAIPHGGYPPYTYVWSVDITGTTQTVKKRYGIIGTKSATVTAKDNSGQTISDTASVQIIDSRTPQ